jgi:PKD domain/FG-GAP-like repeat/ASPIC and UnbV/FlgD Ig-like domain
MTSMRAVFTLLLLLATSPAAAALSHALQPAVRATTDLDANELRVIVSNFGGIATDPAFQQPGLEWRRGSGRSVNYVGGLWIGARVAAETLVTAAEYVWEYAAGPLGPTGAPFDPTESDPTNKVYKIVGGDNASNNPDYANWPIALGAPIDAQGHPFTIDGQTLWCVYNDAVAARHTSRIGGSSPLGVEVRHTVFGYTREGALGRTAFLRFDIHNRGSNLLNETYVGFWFDSDLGGAADDLVGCDSTLDLGFTYNAFDNDAVYGTHAPALGCAILQGPIVAGDTLGMTSFGRLLKDANEPFNKTDSYRRLAGVLPDIAPANCGAATRFEASGDPIYGTGCLDTNPADRRFLVSTGPFTLAPGDSQTVIVALIVGGRVDAGDRLTNLRLLKQDVLQARDAAARKFDNVPSLPESDPGPTLYLGAVNEPLTFDGSASSDPDSAIATYTWDFADGTPLGHGATPSHTYLAGGLYDVTLTVTDNEGRAAVARTRADIYGGAAGVGFGDVTFVGATSVDYLNLSNVHRRALEGVDWGGRFFDGGFDTGCRWSGSSIVATDADSMCPGSPFVPTRFKHVELRFEGTQHAYRYFRRELASGAAPAAGRGYTYAGIGDVPFTAFGFEGDSLIRLEVMFTERQITDDSGTQVGTQPASQNNRWEPTASDSGDFEYLSILDLPLSPLPRPELTQDGVFFAGTQPVLYGGRVRLRAASDVFDREDRIVFQWADLREGRDGVDGAWGDFDGDGDPDLATVSATAPLRVFRNLGPTGFAEVSFEPPLFVLPDQSKKSATLPGTPTGRSVAWIDIDNDGDLDLFVEYANVPNRLFLNSNGTLSEVEVSPLLHVAHNPSWVDFDGDGDLDVYASGDNGPGQLLRNEGGLVFVDATPTALGAGGLARWADFDNDGDLDVFLAQQGPNQLLRNDGPAGFTDVTTGLLADNEPNSDAQWADYDNDGDLDLYVLNPNGNRLLRNDGGTTFVNVPSSTLGVGNPAGRIKWLDIDDDGDLDLFLDGQSIDLFVNQGNDVFEERGLFLLNGPLPYSVADADYDRDGDVDLYFMSGAGPNTMERNFSVARPRYFRVDLRGQLANRFAVGTRVRLVAHGVSQTREVGVHDAGTLLFGLGGASSVDTVEVRWPSGLIERRTGLPVFGSFAFAEGNSSGIPPPAKITFGRVMPNPGKGGDQIFEIRVPGPSTVTLQIYDIAGRRIWKHPFTAQAPGTQLVRWNGRDDDGREAPAAVYFARVEDASGHTTKRFVRVK